MKVGIIGLGLMGGSFSYDMRELYPDAEIFGLDLENHNFKIALKTSIIDSKLDIKNIYDCYQKPKIFGETKYMKKSIREMRKAMWFKFRNIKEC